MWVLDPAPCAKYSEVTDIWLFASKELIRCLVQKWVLDPAPCAKYSEVTDIWLFASKELIRCLVQKLVKINMVDDMACSINGFRPELSWSLVFIEHRPGHHNECSVLAFHDAILLRRVRS